MEGEARYVYYGETDSGRLLAVVLSSAAKPSESLTCTTWMPGRRRITSPGACEGVEGIGYQTLLKMLVHEGLRREARRA